MPLIFSLHRHCFRIVAFMLHFVRTTRLTIGKNTQRLQRYKRELSRFAEPVTAGKANVTQTKAGMRIPLRLHTHPAKHNEGVSYVRITRRRPARRAAVLDRQHGLWIEGRQAASDSEKRLNVYNPATGEVIASTADASVDDVDRAVMSGWRAFVARSWAGRLPAERERILLRFADLVEQHGEELAQLETRSRGNRLTFPAPSRWAAP